MARLRRAPHMDDDLGEIQTPRGRLSNGEKWSPICIDRLRHVQQRLCVRSPFVLPLTFPNLGILDSF